MTVGRKTGGRKKGSVNKTTRKAREAVADLVEGNVDRVQGWLDGIERENGSLEAYKAFMQLMEYHVPKLSRAEVTGKNGGPVEAEHTIDPSKLSDAALQELMDARDSDR